MVTFLWILLVLYIVLTYTVHTVLYTWVLIKTNAYLNTKVTSGSGLLGVKKWYREHYLPPPSTSSSDFYYIDTTRNILKASWVVRILFAPFYFPLSIVFVLSNMFNRYLETVK